MQFTVDTRNATAFELNALAEFVQKLASVASLQPGRAAVTPAEPLPVNGSPDRHINVEVHLPEGYGAAVTEGNGASGAPELPLAAGPAPEVPPVPGNTPPAVAAAPESTVPTDVPAVPTSVPAAPASTPEAAPAAGQVELDSAGCPWDARIHTSNKATIGDGTWRKKPGVDPAYFESVRNELMAGSPQAITITGSTPGADTVSDLVPPVPETAPGLLTGNDVMARAMEIQMADGTKSAALFQAIQGAGIPAGPMGLPGCTDQAVLAAALAAVNAVGAQ